MNDLHKPTQALSRPRFVLLVAGYFTTLLAVITLVFYVRQQAIATFDNPNAQQKWEDWRAAAKQQAEQGPVHRRAPKSQQPPSLVLLRDYFPIVVAAAIIFTSALYVMFTFLLRGAMADWKSNPSRNR